MKTYKVYLLIFMILIFCLLTERSTHAEQPQVILTASNASQKIVATPKDYIDIDEIVRFTPELKVVEELFNKEEIELLAKIINAEAGNQPYEGMLAVGNVVLNRVESDGFPDTIRGVIYQKGQFQPVSNGAINKPPSEEAIQAAKAVLEGVRVIDEDVIFFYNPKISTSKWIFTRHVVFKIGDHAFAI